MSAAAPRIHLVFGPVGAGKSTHARALAVRESAVRPAIDDWRHELFAPDIVDLCDFGWIMARVQRCEQRIRETALDVLRTGTPVVLDLGLMKAASRAAFRAWAAEHGHALVDHFVRAAFSFGVTPMMFEFMEGLFEPPVGIELAAATVIDTTPTHPETQDA